MDVSVECAICTELVVDNRQCPQCQHLFCAACIRRWVQSHAQLVLPLPTCPTCRAPVALHEFTHNSTLQMTADASAVMITCPFYGCNTLVDRRDLDIHTFQCSYRTQYSDQLLAQYTSSTASNVPSDSGMSTSSSVAEAPSQRALDQRAQLEQEQQRLAATGLDTIVHYVSESDTLAGIAVRYGTDTTELRRLNRMQTTDVIGYYSLLVPRPKDMRACDVPLPDPEVIEALRRRMAIKTFMRVTHEREPGEALAYLSLAGFNVDKAIAKFQDDVEWQEASVKDCHDFGAFLRRVAGNAPSQARADTLEALKRGDDPKKSGGGVPSRSLLSNTPCGRCVVRPLSVEPRVHCAACGAVLCRECSLESPEIPKSRLGATSDDPCRVCVDCAALHKK